MRVFLLWRAAIVAVLCWATYHMGSPLGLVTAFGALYLTYETLAVLRYRRLWS